MEERGLIALGSRNPHDGEKIGVEIVVIKAEDRHCGMGSFSYEYNARWTLQKHLVVERKYGWKCHEDSEGLELTKVASSTLDSMSIHLTSSGEVNSPMVISLHSRPTNLEFWCLLVDAGWMRRS
jgi:hypothetical protein